MAVHPSPASSAVKPIAFGTDGWRGLIAADFTFDRLAQVAPVAAMALAQTYGNATKNRTVIVGYDRRFLSTEFAQSAAEAVKAAGFDVLLSETYAPTPAFSWAAKQQGALGALVITASHNPGGYSGLKVKGAFGGSVPPEVTGQIEALLSETPTWVDSGSLQTFNPWQSYCEVLRTKVDIPLLQAAIAKGKLTVFADVMHGAAAGGLAQLLDMPVQELNSDRDPLFGGGAPEPLPRYLSGLFRQIRTHRRSAGTDLSVGLVFDGDSDRIAAVDGQGNFLSSQILIPILIEHLVRRGFQGEVVKTISGSNLIPLVAGLYDLPVFETPIGYKYIADRMLEAQVLLGGEESGGIGYGNHIPERDALLSALYLLEAIVQSGSDLGDLYRQLQQRTGFTAVYDRIDLPLASMEVRSRLLAQLQTHPPTTIAEQSVIDCLAIDGYKFQLADQSWLLIRFSGTEPVLRLYSEAANSERVRQNLTWAKRLGKFSLINSLMTLLVVATSNPGKIEEMQAYLAKLDWQLVLKREDLEIEEIGATFLANACLKASQVAQAMGEWAIADDSGLAVDALGGAPGIYSARYGKTDRERIERLLCELGDALNRQAQFVCALAIARPDGAIALQAEGICRGEILHNPRGNGGFGYDPIFYAPEQQMTFAEMPPEMKRTISHRGRAFQALLPQLKALQIT